LPTLYADPHQFFDNNLIRPHTYNGELYVFAVDLANALGKSTQTVLRYVEQTDVTRVNVNQITDLLADRDEYTVPTAGNPVRIMLNLPAVFTAVNRIKSPNSEAFKRWINRELLPNYYRNGYVTREEYEEMEARAVIAEGKLLLIEERDNRYK
jgi:prophage antirepressor-like protein